MAYNKKVNNLHRFQKLKDLRDILMLFEENLNPMEQCEDFLKIADIISHFDKTIKPIDKIVYYAGNEKYLVDLVGKILQYLRHKSYLNEDNSANTTKHDNELRKINFLLFLNSEIRSLPALKNNESVQHVLQMMPVLRSAVIFSCVRGLNLDDYFYEIIRYTPLWFCQPFLEDAAKSMKISKPYEILERSKMIIESMYFNIIRSDCERYKNNNNYIGQYNDSINAFLKIFSEPETTAMEKWKKMQKFEYQGHVLKTLLEIVLKCLNFFFKKRTFTLKDKHSLYRLLQQSTVESKVIKLENFSTWTEGVLEKINNSLLNTLQLVVFDVSIDLFMSWAEFQVGDHAEEEDGKEPETLQQIIGELAYKLRDIIEEENIDHDIIKQLIQISIKPKTPEQKARELTFREMMTKLDTKFDDREIYFKVFMEKGEAVYGNLECLITVEQNIDLVDFSMLLEMIRFDNEKMDEDEEEESLENVQIRKLIFKIAKRLPLEDIIKLIKYIKSDYGHTFNRYQGNNFDYKIVEFSNKMRFEEEDVIEVSGCYDLIFENGAAFFTNLTKPLYDPGFNNDNFIDEIIKTIEKTKEVAYDYINLQLENILGNEFEIAKSRSLQVFITKLYGLEDFFDRNMFIKVDLMDAIEDALKKGNFEGLLAALSLLKMLLEKNSKFIRADVLENVVLKMSQLSELMRYDLVKNEQVKSVERIQLLEVMLKVIDLILDVLKNLPEGGKSAIIETTTNYTKITRYHFQKLANEGQEAIQFCEYVLGEDLDKCKTKQQIRAVLSKTFVQCTTDEAELLAANPKARGSILDSVLVITAILAQQENHVEAMKHSILNLLIIVDKIILPDKKSDQEISKILKSFQSIIDQVPEASKKAIIEAITSGLAVILTKIEHENPAVDVSFIRKLLNFN